MKNTMLIKNHVGHVPSLHLLSDLLSFVSVFLVNEAYCTKNGTLQGPDPPSMGVYHCNFKACVTGRTGKFLRFFLIVR